MLARKLMWVVDVRGSSPKRHTAALNVPYRNISGGAPLGEQNKGRDKTARGNGWVSNQGFHPVDSSSTSVFNKR